MFTWVVFLYLNFFQSVYSDGQKKINIFFDSLFETKFSLYGRTIWYSFEVHVISNVQLKQNFVCIF